MNMENTGKPQWLIDAEEEIEKFHSTEAGSASDKTMRMRIGGFEGSLNPASIEALKAAKTKEHQSRAGKIGAKNQPRETRVKNGQRVGKWLTKEERSIYGARGGKVAGKMSQQKEYVCPHCGKPGKGSLMFRYHFDRCKHKTT